MHNLGLFGEYRVSPWMSYPCNSITKKSDISISPYFSANITISPIDTYNNAVSLSTEGPFQNVFMPRYPPPDTAPFTAILVIVDSHISNIYKVKDMQGRFFTTVLFLI